MTEEQLLERLATAELRKLTGNPEHWLTTFHTGFWGINRASKNVSGWQRLSPGSLCLFHATGSTRSDNLSSGPAESGVIGVGEVSHLGQKESLEWMSEIEDGVNGWPHLIHFGQTWWFGRTDRLTDEPFQDKMQRGADYIERDIERLVDKAIGLREIEQRTGYRFPPMGSISGIKADAGQQEALTLLIGERLSGSIYYTETPETPDTGGETDAGEETGTEDDPTESSSGGSEPVETGTSVTEVLSRVGQGKFSDQVRDNYGHTCCFPGCDVSDDRYLIGAHIARWADSPNLRGDVSNGLCLCLHHDKAFEVGHFTVDEDLKVWTTGSQVENSQWASEHILPYQGEPIDEGDTPPHPKALQEHWERHGLALE